MSEERRSDERVPVTLEVRWSSLSGQRSARISDISMGGCYVEALAPVTMGEIIRFEVRLPTGRWMPLVGEVAYHLPSMGFGMRFRNLTETQTEVIASLLDYMRGN